MVPKSNSRTFDQSAPRSLVRLEVRGLFQSLTRDSIMNSRRSPSRQWFPQAFWVHPSKSTWSSENPSQVKILARLTINFNLRGKSALCDCGGGDSEGKKMESSPEPINYKSLFKHIFCTVLYFFLQAAGRSEFFMRVYVVICWTQQIENKKLLVGKEYKLFGDNRTVMWRIEVISVV